VEDLANKIMRVLRSPPMADGLRRQGAAEVRRMTWDRAARQCLHVYREAVDPAPDDLDPEPHDAGAEGLGGTDKAGFEAWPASGERGKH
jgi:hypothetical protein